jgi:tRNA threonylcarbamoyladenosine biosynthesis protein TsaE
MSPPCSTAGHQQIVSTKILWNKMEELPNWKNIFAAVMTIVYDLANIDAAAQQLLLAIGGRKVLAFDAPMGAGKTTLIHAICEALGVVDAVGSPTYSIINEYETKAGERVYHLDLYRLKDAQEAVQAGVEDCYFSGALCLVEWPNKALALLPEDALTIQIFVEGPTSRRIAC